MSDRIWLETSKLTHFFFKQSSLFLKQNKSAAVEEKKNILHEGYNFQAKWKVCLFFLPDTLESRAIYVCQEGVGERQIGT